MRRLAVLAAVIVALCALPASSAAAPAGLPSGACQGSNYAMQCKGSTPPRSAAPTHPTATPSVFGVDSYGAANSGIAANFDCSYLSGSPGGKDWTASAIRSWTARHKSVCVVWETYANRAEYGYESGQIDARRARAEAAELGIPTYVPVRFAVDTDTSASAVLSYFQGVKSIIGGRTGVYGSYRVVAGLESAQVTTPAADWQTVAWSNGARGRACLYQSSINHVLNGASVDYDNATCANFGQYPYSPPAPKLVCFGKGATPKNATCRKITAQVASDQRASASSRRAYKARGCGPLVTLRDRLNARWSWFWNHTHVKRLEAKAKQPSRFRALAATARAVNGVRRTITGRECVVFSSRGVNYDAKIAALRKQYSA